MPPKRRRGRRREERREGGREGRRKGRRGEERGEKRGEERNNLALYLITSLSMHFIELCTVLSHILLLCKN